MTDRHAGYLVILQNDLREDDTAGIVAALQHIKGVVDVTPICSDVPLAMARSRVRFEFLDKLQTFIKSIGADKVG